jgi:hypothetical protein
MLGLFLAATFPRVLIGLRTFNLRDYGMFSYPVAAFHRACFWRGEFPLWNPFNHCGVPFLAQWNTLALYPGSLIYLMLPMPWSLSFFCLLHLFWGGLGMYFLARHWTQHTLAGAIAGVIFTFNGLFLNFLMWPSHAATFSWLPWVLWLVPYAWREGGRWLVTATLAAAMQILAGGPETIALTWIILGLLALGDWVRRDAPRAQMTCRFLAVGVLAGLVCAAQLLPFLELLSHSQRDAGYSAATHDWSMPIWGWANFFVPLFRTSPNPQGVFLQNGQYWTSSYYAGIATLLMCAVALRRVRDWRVPLLGGLAFVALVLAWGQTSFLYGLLRTVLPPLGFVRYTVKFVILVLAVAPLLAAFGLQALAGKAGKLGRFEWACAGVALGLITLTVGVDWNANVPDDVHQALWQNGLARALFFAGTMALLAFYLSASDSRRPVLGCLLLVAVWLDLALHVPAQNPTVSPVAYETEAHPSSSISPFPSRTLVSAEARDKLSIGSLPDGLENYRRNRRAGRADCNLLDELPIVDGFFSLTPRESARVTALPYDRPPVTSPALLDFLAVSQTTTPGTLTEWTPRATAMPIITAGQQPVFADDAATLDALRQTNSDFHQSVYLPPEARGAVTAARSSDARVVGTLFANERIAFQTTASVPTVVVVAQTWYPGWRATVDGKPVKIWRANYAFQALEVPAGQHHAELVYQDRAFLLGLFLSGAGLLACVGLWFSTRRSNNKRSAHIFL